MKWITSIALASALATTSLAQGNGAQASVPSGNPLAMIDLATSVGVATVKGQWRYSDTKIIEVDFRAPGAARASSWALI